MAVALLKETITAVLESAGRVCTFKAHEDVKEELYSYFNSELHRTLKEWFLNCFKKSFKVYRWNYQAVSEIEVSIYAFMLIVKAWARGF